MADLDSPNSPQQQHHHSTTNNNSTNTSSPTSTPSTTPKRSSSNNSLKVSKKVSKVSAFNDSVGIIYLNIGGTLFATSRETLTKNNTSSMLSAMFSGNFSSRRDYNGAYFIDRDSTYFPYILNFLRDGIVDLPDDEYQIRRLHREALFYQIDGLIKQIEESLELLQRKTDTHGEYAVAYLGGYGKSSQIYSKDTSGGFSSSCVTLNTLATEGVCSKTKQKNYSKKEKEMN